MQPPPLHKISITVRPYECDAYGHVNNAVYLNYLEHARSEFLREKDVDYQAFIGEGFGIWVVEAQLHFKAPAFPDDILTIESRPIDLGGSTAVIEHKIYKAEKEHQSERVAVLEASVKLVWVNAAGRPIRIPDDWRRAFATFNEKE